MNRHKARINHDVKCPVCHAAPRMDCVFGEVNAIAGKFELDDYKELSKDQVAFFEFTILSSIHQLQELRPDHILVLAVQAALADNPDSIG